LLQSDVSGNDLFVALFLIWTHEIDRSLLFFEISGLLVRHIVDVAADEESVASAQVRHLDNIADLRPLSNRFAHRKVRITVLAFSGGRERERSDRRVRPTATPG
jgi:hypothetical protein